MDPYLESLVKKEEKEAVTEEAVEEVLEEITQQPQAEVEEIEVTEEVVEDVAEPEVAEAVEENIEVEAVGQVSEPEVAEEPEVIEEAMEADPEKVEVAFQKEGSTSFVKNLKIFNAPDAKGVFRIYTGNIILGAKISEEFTSIDYMKPGFGLVKGYIQKQPLFKR